MLPKIWWCSYDFKLSPMLIVRRLTSEKLKYLLYSTSNNRFIPSDSILYKFNTSVPLCIIKFVCSVSGYGDKGYIQNHGWPLYLFKNRYANFPRYFISLPNNGQRARSRAKTCRRILHKSLKLFSMIVHFKKVHIGSIIGEEEKKKKIQKKLLKKKSSSSKKNSLSKKNKPVVRSRDSKKSVWG